MSSSNTATVRAHPNIALVKYWGKRDEALILPHQSSLSVTLAPLEVTTTVELGRDGSVDEVSLHGKPAKGKEHERVVALLNEVRRELGRPLGAARVTSTGNFPMAAGLASSAAGFAALAVAARAAAGLARDTRQESVLARRGSGSACRSIQGGVCIWNKGSRPDGSDSYADQLVPHTHWPELRLVVAVLHREEKEVGSRDGMRSTVETSPYYPAWARDADAEIERARGYVLKKDLEALGALSERNAWRMHASALAADPPLCYLKPRTLELIQGCAAQRKKGVPVWSTLDAGPNPVLLTDAAHEQAAAALARDCGALDVVHCVPGGDAELLK